jgi:hypothetical protein
MDSLDQQAFDLGWDYATFRLQVPEVANKLFCDGYRAFGSDPGKTTRKPDRYVRKWLQIRFGALARGKPFSPQVSPDYLRKITPSSGRCPVIGAAFTYGTGADTDWSIDRANNDRGYACGNIIIISTRANHAKSNRSLEEIRALAASTTDTDGLTPAQWHKLATLIEPAFGTDDASASPIPILFGQPVALGMPVSPIAGFQVALTRALIAGWDTEQREFAERYVGIIGNLCCRTKGQRRAFARLVRAVLRRSMHNRDYADLWSTRRVQKCLFEFVASLDGRGLKRLAELQQVTTGAQNTQIV